MNKITLLTCVTIALLLAGCSSPAIATSDTRSTINVNATGFASTAPDIVNIQLGVESIDTNPAQAVSANTAAINDVMHVLESMNIISNDVQTIYYSMWVEDIYGENGQLTGERRYRVTNQINVRLQDLNQTGELLENAIDAGATTVAGITFGVADTTDLEQEALDNAIAEAQQKAERIAEKMGMSLGSVISISEGNPNATPIPLNDIKGLGGGGSVPISEGQFSMTMTVRIVYELIPITP
ncbi:MAG: SIMPL domain-containing protein [Anaerolineales bacterium]|nr:SIMPL domain-containing protein [Chloroflexota bacterium]MBL6983451.1 SIMPL domain-containing protein [Anaerolineales bacterium]